MERKTVISLLNTIQVLQDQLNMARIEMERLNLFHKEIQFITETFSFESEAKQLARIISERDMPLKESEIRSVFETSGFAYNNEDIDLAAPDRDEQVDAYRIEMGDDYTSVFGRE